MGIHRPEEIEQKRQAIDISIEAFVMSYMSGHFEDQEDLMFHYIESIDELIREYKREII